MDNQYEDASRGYSLMPPIGFLDTKSVLEYLEGKGGQIITDTDGVIVSGTNTLRNLIGTNSFLEDNDRTYVSFLVKNGAVAVTNRSLNGKNGSKWGSELLWSTDRLVNEFKDCNLELVTGLDRQLGEKGLPILGHIGLTDHGAWSNYREVLSLSVRNKIEANLLVDGSLDLYIVYDTFGTGMRSYYSKLKRTYVNLLKNNPSTLTLNSFLLAAKKGLKTLLGGINLSRVLIMEERFAKETAVILLQEFDEITNVNIHRLEIQKTMQIANKLSGVVDVITSSGFAEVKEM